MRRTVVVGSRDMHRGYACIDDVMLCLIGTLDHHATSHYIFCGRETVLTQTPVVPIGAVEVNEVATVVPPAA